MAAASPTDPPILTRAQARRVDEIAATELGIPTILLMEHAAMALARIALEMLPGGDAPATVLVLAGPGSNGGDGFALARLLCGGGHHPIVACAAPEDRYVGDALTNLKIVRRMGIPVVHLVSDDAVAMVESFIAENPPAPALVVDGLLGTGARAPVREPIASIIGWINGQGAPVVAIDLPTGLDADTGGPVDDRHPECIVRAKRTLTLGAAKAGVIAARAQGHVGRLAVCDLGLPRWVVDRASAG